MQQWLCLNEAILDIISQQGLILIIYILEKKTKEIAHQSKLFESSDLHLGVVEPCVHHINLFFIVSIQTKNGNNINIMKLSCLNVVS